MEREHKRHARRNGQRCGRRSPKDIHPAEKLVEVRSPQPASDSEKDSAGQPGAEHAHAGRRRQAFTRGNEDPPIVIGVRGRKRGEKAPCVGRDSSSRVQQTATINPYLHARGCANSTATTRRIYPTFASEWALRDHQSRIIATDDGRARNRGKARLMARLVVVLVNRDGETVLPACLDALKRQAWRDFELVIVDNASSDGSVACARRHFPDAEIVRNDANLGFAAANNIGIARALADPTAAYVLTLNNDTIPAPDFIARLIAAADASTADYGSWQGKVVSAEDPRVLDAVGVELSWDSVATQVGQREIDVGQYSSGDIYGVNAAAAMYTREFIEDVMLAGEFFDSDFFSYLEDVDVAVRGVARGWKAALVADAVVRHVGSATSGPDSTFKWGLSSRNKLFLQVKNYSKRDIAMSVVLSLEQEVRVVLALLESPLRPVVGPYLVRRLRAIGELRPILAKRGQVLRRRIARTIFAPPREPILGAAPRMRMSVVIVNWNGGEGIGECLASLRGQSLDSLEVIVVDNGSTDGSVKFIREQHPEVIVLPLRMNYGFAGAANAGIEASNGEFVALLDHDAIPDPRWAEELLAAMDHADIAASPVYERDDPRVVSARGELLSKWGLPFSDGRGETIAESSCDGYPEVFAASRVASIYRRAVFGAIGTFDIQFFTYFEDVDLSFRARLAGYRIVLAPRARVLRKGASTGRSVDRFQLYHLIKNSQLLVWKNLPRRLLVKVLPRFLAIHVLLFGGAVRHGAGLTALRAYTEVAATFPLVLVKRRSTQRRRKVSTKEVERWLTDRGRSAPIRSFLWERPR